MVSLGGLARKLFGSANDRRVRGYKDPLFVETRAEARIVEAELAVREATAKRDAATALLASYWGGDGAGLAIDEGIEKPDPDAPPLAEADAAMLDAAVARARAGVVVEQSRAVQDFSVSGGARFLRETNDVAVLAGVSIPLGRFDRNQGNIERAQAERRRVEYQSEADRLERLRREDDAEACGCRGELARKVVRAEDRLRSRSVLRQPHRIGQMRQIAVPDDPASVLEALQLAELLRVLRRAERKRARRHELHRQELAARGTQRPDREVPPGVSGRRSPRSRPPRRRA